MDFKKFISTIMGCSNSSSNREFHSYTHIHQENRNNLNKQPNLIPCGTRKNKKKIWAQIIAEGIK